MAYTDLLEYIDSYWGKIIIKPKPFKKGREIVEQVLFIPRHISDNKQVISVPYACIVPNHEKFSHVFYWDTFFMFRGIIGTRYEWVIPSMVENFIYLFKKYHIIPNLTHAESLGRSQPPFLTSMILDAYDVIQRSKKITSRVKKLIETPDEWLLGRMTYAQQEYEMVWQNAAVYNHLVPEFKLNRYGNTDVGYAQDSEQESGWDMTSRFYNRCNQFLPVDLNCYLYKYEEDFAHVAQLLNQKRSTSRWDETAKHRKNRINNLMWNNSVGFYMDYDYVHGIQSEFMSLAGFVPLWAGIANMDQAKRVRKHLERFETPYGLTITDKGSLPPKYLSLDHFPAPYQTTIREAFQPKQWDYPHIWPPLEYLSVIGLLRYGFIADAKRIMKKSLAANEKIFQKYHTLLEKMDGKTGDMPSSFWYPTQKGFGWTNATAYRYTKLLEALENKTLFDTASTDYPRLISVFH